MRLALILPGGVDRSGETRVIPALVSLIERLAARHELRVYALYAERASYPLRGAVVEGLGRRFAPALPRLLRSLEEHGPFDVLHAFWAETPGVLAAAAGRVLGLPWIVSFGGGELAALADIGYGSGLRARTRLRTRLALLGASRVTAASLFLCQLARARGWDVTQVPLGVDESWLAAREEPRPPWRLLHVGSLNRVKDQSTLLRAFAVVLAAEPSARLDVVGGDTLGGVVEREAAALGLQDTVTFHGELSSPEVRALCDRAHLFLLASRHEAGPVAFLEAASRGVPTVGTAVGHVADLAPEAALAVPVGGAAALGGAALALLRDGARRREMGLRAREFAREHDADFTAGAFERIYRQVI